MAKKGRIRYRTKKVIRRARGGGGGLKPIVDGVLAGVGGAVASKYIPGGFGAPIGTLAVGYFRKNSTLKTLGGVQLGMKIAGMIPGVGAAGNGNGGIFEG